MKKILFIFPILLFSILFFSSNSFAQAAPGDGGSGTSGSGSDPGSGVGGVTYTCPDSYTFKRNNGNGWGVCHGDAQVTVSYSQIPDVIPQLTGIYYNGDKITTIQYPADGQFINKTQPYVSYCLTGGNIPPAKKLTLEFTYPDGHICTTDNGASN